MNEMLLTASAPISKSHGLRERALAAYVRRILRAIEAPTPTEPIIAELSADAWIRSQLTATAPNDGEDATGPAAFVTHGCALVLKGHADVATLISIDESTSQEVYAIQASLMLDVAIGIALLREIQHAVDEQVKAGRMVQAKRLTQFGHRVRKTVAEVKEVMAESERHRAEHISQELTDRPRDEVKPSSTPDLIGRNIEQEYDRTRRRRRARAKLPLAFRRPSSTESLSLTLCACLLVWVGLVRLPQQLNRGPEVLTPNDFADSIVTGVEARPPSLYVTLDASIWANSDAATRRRIVDQLAGAPVSRAYAGALIKTSDGRPVASWLRDAGTRVFDGVEETPAADGQSVVAIFTP